MKQKLKFLLEDNNLILYQKLVKNFGFIFAIKRFILKNLAIGTGYRINFYNMFIRNYVRDYFANVVEGHTTNKADYVDFTGKIPVFVMWWQGEEQMPKLIQLCVASQKKSFSSAKFDYYIIDKDNLSNYLTLPQYILDKVNDGTISITHLSDIIRVGLLKEYGGFYLDATFFISREFDLDILEYDLFSIKKINSKYMIRRHVAQGKWMGNFWYSKPNNVLFSFMWEAFLYYHKNNDILIDFYLIDYLIDLAYKEIEVVKKQIDSIPLSENSIYLLQNKLNEVGDLKDIKNLLSEGIYFKMSYKQELVLHINGEKTRYSKLLTQYGVGI